MPTQEDQDYIQTQRLLLSSHRQSLSALLTQRALYGRLDTPTRVISEIAWHREQIRQIKEDIRSAGESVSDERIDEEDPSEPNDIGGGGVPPSNNNSRNINSVNSTGTNNTGDNNWFWNPIFSVGGLTEEGLISRIKAYLTIIWAFYGISLLMAGRVFCIALVSVVLCPIGAYYATLGYYKGKDTDNPQLKKLSIYLPLSAIWPWVIAAIFMIYILILVNFRQRVGI